MKYKYIGNDKIFVDNKVIDTGDEIIIKKGTEKYYNMQNFKKNKSDKK